MSMVYDMIKTIVIYLILVAVVMNILGTSSYKKYVAMFTGMLLIYIAITPIMKLFHMTDEMDYHFEENFLKVEARGISETLQAAEEEQKSFIFNEYKGKLMIQIEDILKENNLYLTDHEIVLEEDESKESFGKIVKLYLQAEYSRIENEKGTSRLIADEIRIDKVDIEQVKDKDDLDSSIPQTDSILEITVKNELASFYNLNKSDITIDIEY